MNTVAGDPDLEEATDLEDEGIAPWTLAARKGAGCLASDTGEDDDPDSEHDGREEEHQL